MEPQRTRVWLVVLLIAVCVVIGAGVWWYFTYIYKSPNIQSPGTYVKRQMVDERPIIIPDFFGKQGKLVATSTPAGEEGRELLLPKETVSNGSLYEVPMSLMKTAGGFGASLKGTKFSIISTSPSIETPTIKLAESVTGRYYLVQFKSLSATSTQVIYSAIEPKQ